MFENHVRRECTPARTCIGAQKTDLTRRAAVGCLAGAALAAGTGLALNAGPLATAAQAEEASPALPAATGFALPEGLALAADGTLGDVLVVVTGGGSRAVVGELFATEAKRRCCMNG